MSLYVLRYSPAYMKTGVRNIRQIQDPNLLIQKLDLKQANEHQRDNQQEPQIKNLKSVKCIYKK